VQDRFDDIQASTDLGNRATFPQDQPHRPGLELIRELAARPPLLSLFPSTRFFSFRNVSTKSRQDHSTAARFGALKQRLASRGRTKADVDLHITPAAIDSGATLVTNDGALLAGDIEDLVAENWI
jgi:hypothetical protein